MPSCQVGHQRPNKALTLQNTARKTRPQGRAARLPLVGPDQHGLQLAQDVTRQQQDVTGQQAEANCGKTVVRGASKIAHSDSRPSNLAFGITPKHRPSDGSRPFRPSRDSGQFLGRAGIASAPAAQELWNGPARNCHRRPPPLARHVLKTAAHALPRGAPSATVARFLLRCRRQDRSRRCRAVRCLHLNE